jgi:transcriptional regulator with XRE-family HTH domain
METNKSVGNHCRRLLADLQQRQWSYAQIGRVMGVRRSQVCNLSKGRSVRPTDEHMAALIALHATGLPGPYNPHDMTRRKVRHEAL